MKDRILFVGNANTFTVNTFIENLEDQGFQCEIVIPRPNAIAKMDPTVKSVILFLDEDVFEDSAMVSAIIEFCQAGGQKLILVGYESEIVHVMPQFPSDMVSEFFTRPVSAADVAAVVPHTASTEERPRPTGKKQILVVDDSGPMLRSVKSWLEPKYKVIMVNSATACLFYLDENEPDLILLDYEMPNMDGPTLLGLLRKNDKTKDIPVIFLTAKDDLDSVLKAAVHKPDGYVLKAQSRDKIVGKVDNFFKEHP